MNPRKNRQWQALQKYENKRPPKRRVRTGRVKKTRHVYEIKKIDRNLASPKATGTKKILKIF